ncbi:MAG: sugar phosphate isomerase/epimerase [Isosphaeraceae bacterium]
MRLGIFARTFPRGSIEDSLDAVAAHGLTDIQFNLSLAGLPTLPERIEERFCAELSAAIRERGLSLTALSGTFNMIGADHARFDPERLWERIQKHTSEATMPDPERILEEFIAGDRMLERLERLAAACRHLDTRIITLCTGTCDPEDQWKWHPDNVRRGVWNILVHAMKQVARIADRYEVTMAIEPESGNVVNSAIKARMLLDELGSPWIKIVIDPANLHRPGDPLRMRELLDEAFEWLGPDICLAHAKELSPEGEAGGLGPGKGTVDWDHYLNWLHRINYEGPLIIHGLPEEDVADSVQFLRSRLRQEPEVN